jgi:hypothetical protein
MIRGRWLDKRVSKGKVKLSVSIYYEEFSSAVVLYIGSLKLSFIKIILELNNLMLIIY